MSNFLALYAVPIAVGAVALVLVLGLTNMLRGGSPNTSQKLMRLRVVLQLVAIIVIMVTIWFMGRGLESNSRTASPEHRDGRSQPHLYAHRRRRDDRARHRRAPPEIRSAHRRLRHRRRTQRLSRDRAPAYGVCAIGRRHAG